jgi:glycosyltransferase involved in cell wall biosynthesis
MKILFSPCHYVYEDHIGGSELSWAFNLADKLSNIYPDSTVITGFKDISKTKKYKIIELQKNKKIYDRSVKNAVIFNIKYTINTNKILKKEHFDIIHHVLPFFINRTFNLSKNKNIPFVIGPIQSPLEYKDKDIYSNNHQNKYLYKKINWIFSFALFPFSHIVKKLSKNTLLKADKLIVINNHTKHLITKMGIGSEKIDVIAPGIDTKKFKY